ncbi:helix-turn-helix domain-containing protein [Flavobacterium rivuli]|uniref:helix-turn-helix domain-containing protein n=1 Tax=Flavobacterium rivuli TaxID=498301 RepID=UPI00036871E9|nr:helix-turn-helix domain-containing protein [Flavobacterium rivuli]
MDFYTKLNYAKLSKILKIKDLAALLNKEYDTVRMAIKRKSLSDYEKRIISDKFFTQDKRTTFSLRFSEALSEKGLTAYELSKLTNISQSTISFYKSGRNVPKSSNLTKIAQILEVDKHWLETGEGNMHMDFDIEHIRTQLGFSLESFAKLLKINVDELRDYSNGKPIPDNIRTMLLKYVWGTGIRINPYIPLTDSTSTIYKNSLEYENNIESILSVRIVRAPMFSKYLKGYREPTFFEGLPTIEFSITKRTIEDTFLCFEAPDESMNGGLINDAPIGAEMLCKKVSVQFLKFNLNNRYGFVIVLDNTILHKDVLDFDELTGDIRCGSRTGLPQHSDFTINDKDVNEIWCVIKRTF